MGGLPVALVILSTFMHAGWNILARRKGGEQDCMWRMQVAVVVIGAVPALISLASYPSISRTALLCLLGSGSCCGLYYVCLARAYESADFTTVYPAARALPVLIVGIGCSSTSTQAVSKFADVHGCWMRWNLCWVRI